MCTHGILRRQGVRLKDILGILRILTPPPIRPRGSDPTPGGDPEQPIPRSLATARSSAILAQVTTTEGPFLIVEDDESVSAALRRTFDRFRPTHSVTTLSAARDFFATSPDCSGLVVDLGLPDGSGLTLVSEVRARNTHLPVLILTGTAAPALINAAFALRADYLCKPGSREDFVAFIRRALLAGQGGQKKIDVIVDELVVTKALSAPEAAILRMVASNQPRATLAAGLGINENTLKTQIRVLLRKCEAGTLDDLVRQILRRAIDS